MGRGAAIREAGFDKLSPNGWGGVVVRAPGFDKLSPNGAITSVID